MSLTARLFNSQEEERRRIARELHDVTAQNLFAISINIGQLRRQSFARSSEPGRLLEECEWLCEQSLQEIRTLSYLLHPPLLGEAGLMSALQWYVEGFTKRTGIFVDLIVLENIGRLPSEVEIALFRIVQEGLTNIRRHSGSETASIRLEQRAGAVFLEIRDRGCGMLTGEGREGGEGNRGLGVGIPGMRQRLHQLGGRLEIESNNEGTTVRAVVPVLERKENGVRVGDEHDTVRSLIRPHEHPEECFEQGKTTQMLNQHAVKFELKANRPANGLVRRF